MEACLRMEGIPAVELWELVIDVFEPVNPKGGSQKGDDIRTKVRGAFTAEYPMQYSNSIYWDILKSVDYVPTNVPAIPGRAKLIILEDNDAVIKICIKGRSLMLRHVARTHRVDLDALYVIIATDPGIAIRYVNTKMQIADIFTKGSFTAEAWRTLCKLLQVGSSYLMKSNPAKAKSQAKSNP